MDDASAPSPIGARTSWSNRYVGVALVLIGLCLPAIMYFSGYRAQSFNELLSFRVDDGWCIKGVESIGQHCFGDYAGVDKGLRAGNFWDPTLPSSTAYPPLSLVPSLAFVYLGRITGSWALGRNLFLLLVAGSLLSPAAWVSRQRWRDRGPVSFLILGIASVPFLVILDRGNTAGLLVAPLLGVATAYMNEQHRRMLIWIVVCALLKPQMLLLSLLFIVYRRYAHLVLTIAITTVLTFAGFLFFPGSFSTNVSNWLHQTRGYQTYQAFTNPYPYNLSAGRSMLTIFDFSHLESLTGAATRSSLASWLQLHSGLLSVVLIGITIAMLFARTSKSNLLHPLLAVCILIAIAPGTSYSYYLALLLVPAAFVLRDPRPSRSDRAVEQWSGILDRDDAGASLRDRVYSWMLILGLALVFVPLVIPVASVPLLDSQLHAIQGVGALQLLWGPILLVLFLLTAAMAWPRSSRRPLAGNPSKASSTTAELASASAAGLPE